MQTRASSRQSSRSSSRLCKRSVADTNAVDDDDDDRSDEIVKSKKRPSSVLRTGKAKVIENLPVVGKGGGRGKVKAGQGEEEDKSALEVATENLHVSSVPETMPCREDEYQAIFSFLYDCIDNGRGQTLYISGVPGTGKTATVKEVVRNLELLVPDDVSGCYKSLLSNLFAFFLGTSLCQNSILLKLME